MQHNIDMGNILICLACMITFGIYFMSMPQWVDVNIQLNSWLILIIADTMIFTKEMETARTAALE